MSVFNFIWKFPGEYKPALSLILFILFFITTPSLSTEIDYEVDFEGSQQEDLLEMLQNSSNLTQLRILPLATSAGLIHRAKQDQVRLQKVLESFGYYSGTIEVFIGSLSLEKINSNSIPSNIKHKVKIKVTPGPQYRFNKIRIKGLHPSFIKKLTLPISRGEPSIPSKVLDLEKLILTRLNKNGFPYGAVKKRTLTIDTEKNTMDVFLKVSIGPRVRLGKLIIKGTQTVSPAFIAKLAPWKRGEFYNPKKFSDYKSNLLSLEVFSSIKLKFRDNAPKHASKTITLPVILHLKERKRKFIGAGVNYSNNIGGEIKTYWGHRNLFGQGERLKITGTLSRIGINEFEEINKTLHGEFLKPEFLTRKQDFLINGSIASEKFDSYEREAVFGSLGLKRQFTPALSGTASVTAELSEIENNNGLETFGVLGLPLAMTHDTRDDYFDPRSGMSHEIGLAPYLTLVGPGTGFTILSLTSRGYWDVLNNGRAILAGRFTVGSILADMESTIPSDKRFYAGGGGSIRGYEFQQVGPLDNQNDPLGAESLMELSLELRLRIGDIGVVPFIDGGNAFDSELPDLDEGFQWGAGVGFRYYTSFGPLRLDVGFPVNKRPIDDDWAFYISIGQSF
ncbi:MAG: BamA/TamA family outer membrane protein [Candidatus Nitronauta litoralis]|uniref:BamA/TamA family outer membrane protein n=1 Tax=Candidatus Nitronauta litoralis TaxID=2705533 RepID=A0A7T0BWM2_9BACT|nr:MAG: BamA/TamA family outer membrane protein [Candidatus Nitronauta litoralis]